MIRNDKQFQLTRKKLQAFTEALEELQVRKGMLVRIQAAALKSQINGLEEEMADYERLRSGAVRSIYIDAIENMHEALIKGRIARGWSQADLAEKMQLKEQQIQRYEATNYTTAGFLRIIEVIQALELDFKPLKAELHPPDFDLPAGIDLDAVHARLKERGSLFSV